MCMHHFLQKKLFLLEGYSLGFAFLVLLLLVFQEQMVGGKKKKVPGIAEGQHSELILAYYNLDPLHLYIALPPPKTQPKIFALISLKSNHMHLQSPMG